MVTSRAIKHFDFQKLAGLWLARLINNHVRIYGSNVAEVFRRSNVGLVKFWKKHVASQNNTVINWTMVVMIICVTWQTDVDVAEKNSTKCYSNFCLLLGIFFMYVQEFCLITQSVLKSALKCRWYHCVIITCDSEVIMFSPFLFVCLFVCMYVCHNVCPDDLPMKNWCHTNNIVQEYRWGYLVVQVMCYILVTSSMTSPDQ